MRGLDLAEATAWLEVRSGPGRTVEGLATFAHPHERDVSIRIGAAHGWFRHADRTASLRAERPGDPTLRHLPDVLEMQVTRRLCIAVVAGKPAGPESLPEGRSWADTALSMMRGAIVAPGEADGFLTAQPGFKALLAEFAPGSTMHRPPAFAIVGRTLVLDDPGMAHPDRAGMEGLCWRRPPPPPDGARQARSDGKGDHRRER